MPAAAERMDAGGELEHPVPAADELHVVGVAVPGRRMGEQVAPATTEGLQLEGG